MLDDAQAKLDNSVQTCVTYNHETLALLEQIRQDVASFNAAAAEARGRVRKNQGIVALCNLMWPEVKEELDEHNQECPRREPELESQVDIVIGDLTVMGGILDIIGDCGEAGAAALVLCRHCRKTGQGYVMLQDDKLQPLPNQLRSAAANRVGQDFPTLDKSIGEMGSFKKLRDKLQCKLSAHYVQRISHVHLDGGLIPEEIFQIRERKTDLCMGGIQI